MTLPPASEVSLPMFLLDFESNLADWPYPTDMSCGAAVGDGPAAAGVEAGSLLEKSPPICRYVCINKILIIMFRYLVPSKWPACSDMKYF